MEKTKKYLFFACTRLKSGRKLFKALCCQSIPSLEDIAGMPVVGASLAKAEPGAIYATNKMSDYGSHLLTGDFSLMVENALGEPMSITTERREQVMKEWLEYKSEHGNAGNQN